MTRRDTFQAISDPVRRDIIEYLWHEPRSVMQVVGCFKNMTRPGVTKHLKILAECGVITMTRKGREQLCVLNNKSLKQAYLWLEKYQKGIADPVDSFDYHVNQLMFMNAAGIKRVQKRKVKKK